MLNTLPSTSPQHTEPGAVVHYRQTSPELGPAQRLPVGEPRPEGNRRLIPNPSC
ncbi:MAG: hypothetical protein ACKO6G_09385 [Vulcanococcus sp.]